MPESIIITLPKNMSLERRISETSRQITEWLQSFDKPFKDGANKLQLSKCEQNQNEYSYHYSIINRKELSASDVKARVNKVSSNSWL